MGIEINRTRVAADGTVSCEMVFPSVTSYAYAANQVLRIEPAAFAPREPTAPAYSHAEQLDRARQTTLQRIPTASVPPFVDEEEPPLRPVDIDPVAYLAERIRDEEDVPLRAGTAYGSEPHERKAGGTSSDDE